MTRVPRHCGRTSADRSSSSIYEYTPCETVPQSVPPTIEISAKCWSEWQDLNLRPPRPERGALPDCATLRLKAGLITRVRERPQAIDPMTAQAATQVIEASEGAITPSAPAVARAARALAAGSV